MPGWSLFDRSAALFGPPTQTFGMEAVFWAGCRFAPCSCAERNESHNGDQAAL